MLKKKKISASGIFKWIKSGDILRQHILKIVREGMHIKELKRANLNLILKIHKEIDLLKP